MPYLVLDSVYRRLYQELNNSTASSSKWKHQGEVLNKFNISIWSEIKIQLDKNIFSPSILLRSQNHKACKPMFSSSLTKDIILYQKNQMGMLGICQKFNINHITLKFNIKIQMGLSLFAIWTIIYHPQPQTPNITHKIRHTQNLFIWERNRDRESETLNVEAVHVDVSDDSGIRWFGFGHWHFVSFFPSKPKFRRASDTLVQTYDIFKF